MAKLKIRRLLNRKSGTQPVTRQVVRDMIAGNQELKMFTPAATTGTATLTGGTLHRLSDIAQGNDISSRSGDVIIMKKLLLHLNAFDTNATVRSTTVRMIIFADSMGSGANVGISEVLNQTNNLSEFSPINAQRNRFKIYYDDYFSVIAGTNYQERPHRIVCNMHLKRYFNDTSASSTNTGKNSLYLLVLGSTINVTYDYAFQLQYTDS